MKNLFTPSSLYPQVRPPAQRALRDMMTNYKTDGVLRKKRTGNRALKGYEEDVSEALVKENQPVSVRWVCYELEAKGRKLSRPTIKKIALKALDLVKMKRNIGQGLSTVSVERRLAFAAEFLGRMDSQYMDLTNACFSD